MTIYDVAMIGAVIAGVVWGFWRGITWQVASIASLVLGYSASRTLSAQLAPHFPGEPVVARALSMIVIYAAVSGGVFLVAWVVRTTLRKMQFEAYDRHLGMMLGAVEGALLGLIVTLFVVSLAPQTRGPIFASPTGKLVGNVMETLGPVLPGEARRVLAPFWHDVAPDAEKLADETESAPLPEPTPEPKSVGRGLLRGRDSARSAQSETVDRSTPPIGDLIAGEKAKLTSAISDEVEGVRGQAREAARSQLNEVDRSKSVIGDLIEKKKAKYTRAIVDEVKGVRDTARSQLKTADDATPSLGELFDKGEEKIGRAIADKIEKELQQVGTSNANGRPAQRR
ncbi:membrane protein required for colicin V production [Singulisphaera sp. GP187]|uniref:CvpA family protein n=1 Tax=Singulisphaera sp. GP187 TaxID=1882752 RepID=UPI00092BBADC|nr:CvpA family protein [Singulisphaera sp. GP187]SIO25457.1 membrane protein required for colicin V production [Singulisphaera sp. GP187]